MTELERCINYLRHGQKGDYVATEDGKTLVIRKDVFGNTLPNCYIKEKNVAKEVDFATAVTAIKKLIENESERGNG